MIRLIRAELRKLFTTTSVRVAFAAAALLIPIGVISNVLRTAHKNEAMLASPAFIRTVLSVVGGTSMLMIGLGIVVMAGEFRHNTAVPSFLITPRRHRLVLAKILTMTGVGAVVGAIGFGIGVAFALPLLASHGVHHLTGDTAQMWVGATVGSALFGALGVAIGAVTRNTVVAIVGAVVWIQFIEAGLLAKNIPSLGKWLPTGAGLAVSRTAEHPATMLAPLAALVVLVGWTVGLSAIGTRFAVRREV